MAADFAANRNGAVDSIEALRVTVREYVEWLAREGFSLDMIVSRVNSALERTRAVFEQGVSRIEEADDIPHPRRILEWCHEFYIGSQRTG